MFGELVPNVINHPEWLGVAAGIAATAVVVDKAADRRETGNAPSFPDPEQQKLVTDIIKRNRLIKRLGFYAAASALTLTMVQFSGPGVKGPSRTPDTAYIIEAGNSEYQGVMQDGQTPIVDAVNGSLIQAIDSNGSDCVYVVRDGFNPVGCLSKNKTQANVVNMENNMSKVLSPYAQNTVNNLLSPISDSVQAAIMSSPAKKENIIIETNRVLSQTDAGTLSTLIDPQKNDSGYVSKNYSVSAIVLGNTADTAAVVDSYAAVLGSKNVFVADSRKQITADATKIDASSSVDGPVRPWDIPRDIALGLAGCLGIEAIRRRLSGHFKLSIFAYKERKDGTR